MKGLNYKSTLTYSYSKSNEEMQRILELECDGFKNFKLNDDQKIIEYTIDHSRQIQLSQLLYFQDIKLIKLTIAQNIQLCLDILMKYKQLKDQNIQHNYLSSDRIILNIKDKSQSITILPENLYYTIHFVGYDCPFYERDNYIKSFKDDQQSIKEIIINIFQNKKLERLTKNDKNKNKNKDQNKDTKYVYTDTKKQEEKQKEFDRKYPDLVIIFKGLLDEGIFKSFDKFIEASNLIFEKYNNQNNKNQRLGGIDKSLTKLNSQRSRRINNVIENLEKIQHKYYKVEQSYEFQQILQLTFPLIAKELTTATFYNNQYPPSMNDVYIDLKQQFKIDDQMIEQIINDNKEEIMKDFKFELDQETIKKDISQQLIDNKFKLFNYFLNDVKFSIQKDKQIIIQIDKLKKEITKELTIESLQNYLELRILQLIEDLI